MVAAVKLIAFFIILALALHYIPLLGGGVVESFPKIAQWLSQSSLGSFH